MSSDIQIILCSTKIPQKSNTEISKFPDNRVSFSILIFEIFV